MFLPLSTFVTSIPLMPRVCPSHSRGPPQPEAHTGMGIRVNGQGGGRRLLTHTPGTALLWLGHRLGAVDRRAVEAVTTHMGTLKGIQGGGPDSKEPLPPT